MTLFEYLFFKNVYSWTDCKFEYSLSTLYPNTDVTISNMNKQDITIIMIKTVFKSSVAYTHKSLSSSINHFLTKLHLFNFIKFYIISSFFSKTVEKREIYFSLISNHLSVKTTSWAYPGIVINSLLFLYISLLKDLSAEFYAFKFMFIYWKNRFS